MLYSALKTIHLLAVVAWLGGMFFTLVCLRPALDAIDAPLRPRLMQRVLRRFFAVVNGSIALILATGLGMLGTAYRDAHAAGAALQVPLSWQLMIGLGLVMMGIFGYVAGTLFRRFGAALQAGDRTVAGATLERIRRAVLLNLVLGSVIVAAMKLGAAV